MPSAHAESPARQGHDGLRPVGEGEKTVGLRVVHWNVYGASDPGNIANFVSERIGRGPTIVCLQDIKRASYNVLVGLLKPASSRFSLDLREPSRNEGDERTMGIAMFGFGLPISSLELLDRTLYPERTFSVLFGGAFGPIRVVAFDSLAGIGREYPVAKASNFASIADYLQLHGAELDFLCFDANGPKHDSMDPGKLEFSLLSDKGKVKKLALIMGSQKVHKLSDSYVEYLRSRGEAPTRDPLAVSYKTGRPKKKQVEKRYDYIMNARRWRVTHCEYPYEESVAATANHSAVVADFEPA